MNFRASSLGDSGTMGAFGERSAPAKGSAAGAAAATVDAGARRAAVVAESSAVGDGGAADIATAEGRVGSGA